MKKILSLAAIIIGLNAYQINIKSGWQLKGALEDINVTDIFNKPEITSVWTYDDENNKWKVYLPNTNIDLDNYGIKPLNIIYKGEGFWINANNSLLIEIDNKDESILSQANENYIEESINENNIKDNNITESIEYNSNIITEDNLIDTPTAFELTDIANKTFKTFIGDDIIEIAFDSNGVANLKIYGQNYQAKLENGIIKVYDEDNNLIREYKKVKANSNGIIVFGKDKDSEYNSYFSYLKPWLTTINPIDMSTLNYPFTVYEVDNYIEKITFESNKILFEFGWELNSTIKDGKIIATDEYISTDGNYGHTTIYKVQYIGEIDKYKIAKIDGEWKDWEIDNDLIGLTFNDIIDTNQSVFDYILNSDGTASYQYSGEMVYDEYDADSNITYQLISSTEINLTKCYDDGYCYTRNITIDSNTGKITISGDDFSFVTIHSKEPIIINYENNSYRILYNNNPIKDRILRHKKLIKRLF